MRDAFGGAFMIKLFLVFIVIYVGFTALSLNYAKAFKVKNKIINYIEENEITSLGNMSAKTKESLETFIDTEIVGKMNYKVGNEMCQRISTIDDRGTNTAICHNGIVIREKDSSESPQRVYYTVSTYIGWELPFLNSLLSLSGKSSDQDVIQGYWKISGETRVVVKE